jgi:hypothetical protein
MPASAMMGPSHAAYFRWDKRRRVYICPNNKVLHTTGTVHDGTMLRYRASKLDCDVCPACLCLDVAVGCRALQYGARHIDSIVLTF